MPIDLRQELTGIVQLFAELDVDYAVCGGLALGMLGYPRATKDIDILILEKDADEIVSALWQRNFRSTMGWITFGFGTEYAMQMLRLSKEKDNRTISLDLIQVPAFFEDVWESRITIGMGEVPVSVVSRDGLVRMKQWSGRPRDISDIDTITAEGGRNED